MKSSLRPLGLMMPIICVRNSWKMGFLLSSPIYTPLDACSIKFAPFKGLSKATTTCKLQEELHKVKLKLYPIVIKNN